MKNLFRSLSTCAAFAIAGCSTPDTAADPNLLVSADFETLAGWLPAAQSATLSRDKAHSGHYALKVDAAHEYSLGYSAPLGQLHDTRIRKIKVTAWAFVPTADAKATLVTTVSNPAAPNDKPLLWDGLELGKAPAVGKWQEVSKVITLPDNATPANTLGIYLWRTGGAQPVYLDDLRVTLEP
ncbi:MAG: hypothetical protein NVS3B25_16620 [Hymenobacter sp.]